MEGPHKCWNLGPQLPCYATAALGEMWSEEGINSHHRPSPKPMMHIAFSPISVKFKISPLELSNNVFGIVRYSMPTTNIQHKSGKCQIAKNHL